MDELVWRDPTGLGEERLDAARSDLGGLTTLEAVLRWAREPKRRYRLVDVIRQDEFTHDVVVAVDRGHYLALDVT